MGIEVDYVGIGRRIRFYRKQNGMSQEYLAEKADISITHMSHIETASTKLSLPVFITLANILGVTTDQLLYDKPSSTKYIDGIDDIINVSSIQEQKVMYNAVHAIKQSLKEM